jgi:hypothetical protein
MYIQIVLEMHAKDVGQGPAILMPISDKDAITIRLWVIKP